MQLESKHMPGPWESTCGLVGKLMPAGEGWKRIATVADDNEANARLIAAAPELLEACLLFDHAESTSEEQIARGECATRNELRLNALLCARLAIARAKGGAA